MPKKRKRTWIFHLVFSLIALFILSHATLKAHASNNLLSLDNWQVLGTAYNYHDEDLGDYLFVGDEIGRDAQDQDQDENLWSSIAQKGFSPYDYDAIVSKVSVAPPLTFKFSGLMTKTELGYQEVGIAYRNPSYTGELDGQLPIGTKLAYFTLHREEPEVLQTGYFNARSMSQKNYSTVYINGLPDSVDSNGDVWGDFEISWQAAFKIAACPMI